VDALYLSELGISRDAIAFVAAAGMLGDSRSNTGSHDTGLLI
jgi:hypothetical protein